MVKVDLSLFNDDQKKIIRATEGPVLVIAGPGTGKTRTLVERIIYLIVEKGVNPDSLFISTFTDKAAKELITGISNRLLQLKVQVKLNDMYVGTLHSLFLRILEDHKEYTRLKKNYRMLDEFDQQYIIYNQMAHYENIDNVEELIEGNHKRWDKADDLITWINKLTEEVVDVSKLEKSKQPALRAIGEVYKVYKEQLEAENAIDYATIQTETLDLINSNPQVLKKIQLKFQYFMIDEYQDTNTVQELILMKLSGKERNICVVGDDDQSLYRFRGATVRNILEFEKNFKTIPCKKFYLTTNYRSHPKIIDFYNRWMKEIEWKKDGKTFRFDDKIIKEPKEKKFRRIPTVIKVPGLEGKNNWHEEVLKFINKLKSKRVIQDYNQIALLTNSVKNEKITDLAKYLEENDIPVFSPRSNLYFERKEIRLLIGAFYALFPQYGEIRVWKPNMVMNIWQTYDECLDEFMKVLQQPSNKELKEWIGKKGKYHYKLTKNTDYGFASLFYEMIQFPLFAKYLNIDLDSPVFDVRPAFNLSMFSSLLVKYEYLQGFEIITPDRINRIVSTFFNQYLKFLIDGGISEYEEFDDYAPSGCVSFMTIHQSKGLEFPVVIVDSLNMVPRKNSTAEIDHLLQEEGLLKKPPFEPLDQIKVFDFYRLYYTAFSRAQNLLVLSGQEATGKKGAFSNLPSKMFKPLYDTLISWRDEKFDPSLFELEKIKPINLKKEYSFTSHIQLYENCALQYKYFKEMGFNPVRMGATIFGTLVHQTIEDIHKAALRGEVDQIKSDKIDDWFNHNYQTLSKSEKTYLAKAQLNSALEQVKSYVENNSEKWERIREAEVDVSLEKEEYILRGKIDLIRGENDTVEIIDFKATKKPDLFAPENKDRIDRYRRQLEIYSHLVEERSKLKVSKLHIYYTQETSGNPYVTWPRDELPIEATMDVFDSTVRKIERKDYFMKKKPEKQCPECDLRYYCEKNYDKVQIKEKRK